MRVGFLDANTWHGDTAEAEPVSVDVTIVFAGWEARVTEFARYPVVASHYAALVRWREAADEPAHDAIAQRLRARILEVGAKFLLDTQCSMWRALDDTYGELERVIYSAYAALRRPIRIAFDVSNCPEYFPIRLLVRFSQLSIVKAWLFFYAEAEYPLERGRMAFTWGEWNITPIPGLHRPFEPPGRTTLVLGLGFEGAKARQIVSKYQPNQLILLLPNPGFTIDYSDRARVENRELLATVRNAIDAGARDAVCEAPAGDGVAAATAIAGSISPTRVDSANESVATLDQNLVMVPTGPKPHSIGMALVAMADDRATLLYRNPERYEIRDSRNTGRSWVLSVIDPSVVDVVIPSKKTVGRRRAKRAI